MRRIDYWHVKLPYLGSRKITVKLREDGYKVGRKTVRRLMQLMSIYAIYPKANLSKRNCKESIVPYLLRNYAVNFPNQVWSIDITYIPMPMCHMYLTAIIDWYSRKIVGHYLSRHTRYRVRHSYRQRSGSNAWNSGYPERRSGVPVYQCRVQGSAERPSDPAKYGWEEPLGR